MYHSFSQTVVAWKWVCRSDNNEDGPVQAKEIEEKEEEEIEEDNEKEKEEEHHSEK